MNAASEPIIAPDNTPEKNKTKEKPVAPADTPKELYTRRVILAAFWFVVIFLGLPHWIWTTSIYRAELDIAAAQPWIEGRACGLDYLLHIKLLSDLPTSSRATFEDSFLSNVNGKGLYRYTLSDSDDADFTIQVRSTADTAIESNVQGWDAQLDINCPQRFGLDDIRQCGLVAAQDVRVIHSAEEEGIAFTTRNTPFQRFEVSDTTELEKRSTRAFKYASSYHLTFSLFTASALPLSWDIEAALQQYINPLLQSLSGISNFTVDTQVQYFASLSPSMAGPRFDEHTQAWTLDRTDLSGFINAAEWPLNPSIDSGPTINFVLYIPTPEKSPLIVGESSSNSWIIPQWGGVQILNGVQGSALSVADLEIVMYTFADQLAALVGLPREPASLQLRLKSLMRERIASLIVSASSTLGALIRLTEKLEQIAIPQSVAQAVTDSVSDLEHACQLLEHGQYKTALIHARNADEAVEKAFFEPSMVGQVYFPDEHKVAVYVPLLGPMAVPLIMATIKEIKQYRQKLKTS